MADDAIELTRGSVRDSLNQAGELLAYTVSAVMKGSGIVLNRRTLETAGGVLPYPEPAVISGNCVELERGGGRLVASGDLIAYTSPVAVKGISVPVTRIGLPLLYSTDEAQIIVRGGQFDLDFGASPRRGLPPHGVNFYNRSKTPVKNYTWQFGDGDTSTQENPFHIYLDEGIYDVTLTAGANVYGYEHLTKYRLIIVGVQVFIVPRSGKAPLRVSFSFDERSLDET